MHRDGLRKLDKLHHLFSMLLQDVYSMLLVYLSTFNFNLKTVQTQHKIHIARYWHSKQTILYITLNIVKINMLS